MSVLQLKARFHRSFEGSNKRYLTLIALVVFLAVLYQVKPTKAETHPIWDPSGDANQLRSKVASYLNMSDGELRDQLTGAGRSDSHNIDMVEITYDLALLYHLTRDRDYAHRSAVLLDRYADVFPDWPKVYGNSSGYGIWTDWFHLDLGVARKLVEAYDLLINSGAFEELDSVTRDKVRELLIQIIQADFGYRLYSFNMAYWRPLGIVIFGRVLEDPQLVHLGYWYYSKQIHEAYCHDGFWNEGTYSYHVQMTRRYTDPIYKFYFNGYSDPPGYIHEPFDPRWDPPRIENFDLDKHFSSIWDRMRFTVYQTALPNDEWPILNETEYYGGSRGGESASESLLMGGIGHAILAWGEGTSQTQARLDFSHALGHRHEDANHLIFYDKGTELIGGTAYRYGDRDWNVSTLNQNLVVIDGQEQKGAYWVDWTMSPYVPGIGRTTATRQSIPGSANIHNNVSLWEPGYQEFKDVQVVEVDALDAYDQVATQYRRMLALVHIDGNDTYLVDIFRVKGGTQYDWMQHGGHDSYSLATSVTMENASGQFGKITIQQGGSTSATWNATFTYNGAKHRVIMAGEPGTTIYTGEGPRSVQSGGLQDYLIARKMTSREDEVAFLAVHEGFTTSPKVQLIEPVAFDGDPGSAVGLKVTLVGGITDYIIHTLDEGPEYPTHYVMDADLIVRGKFAHIRVQEGHIQWMYLIQGGELRFGSQSFSSSRGDYSYRGVVTKVNRIEEGDQENSFEVDIPLPSDHSLDGKTLILTWGNGWSWGYKIKRVEGNRVITDDEPGFNYDGMKVDMRYFPDGLYDGPVTFIIPGTAIMDGNGNIRSTDGLFGDLNGDGKVDEGDLQHMIHLILTNATGHSSADLNQDGLLDSLDVQMLINLFTGF